MSGRARVPAVTSGTSPERPGFVTAALGPEHEAGGYVVVPVRDAHLVVRTLPLQPIAPEVAVDPIPQGATPAVLACAALMLWIAIRRRA